MIGKEIYNNYIIYPNGVIYNTCIKKELKQRIVNKYKVVTLYINKKRKDIKVHRLVALSFLDNIENKPFVNHIDGNKLNNNVSNLEWCTHRENIDHAILNGLIDFYGEKNPSSKLKKEDILKIRSMYFSGNFSHRSLARKFSISKTQVGRIIRLESWN